MFEDYGFQGVYVAIQAVLTLYAQGILVFRSVTHLYNCQPEVLLFSGLTTGVVLIPETV